MKSLQILTGGLATIAALTLAVGCGGQSGTSTKSETQTEKGSKEADHAHGAGPHGGTLADWGGGKFHVEFTVDHSKQEAAVYVLGDDAKTPVPIKATGGLILLTIKDPPFQVELKAEPQKGESSEKASRFVGKHAKLGKEQEFAGTISGEVDGIPYAADFKEEPEGSEHGKVSSSREIVGDRERDLYMTAGGLYTEEDIKANGNSVPSAKFKGVVWAHDEDLKAGDKVCPVTANKSEAECSWIVGGKKYEFCCPPCLDKFIMWAKTKPEKVKDPGEYVKR
jgi:hypothetical protein